ncbi:hypothetical protein ADUPG1_012371 [Aduncisulcus paluster]|uniref:Metallo-beta-lactamase domain-containing protein n=1 Tax=Aduncisulcus paluster TaxID=2918883 RepID=A0ABQ5JZ80_9EUKA|nr:hypothetical protein ADUPG1_012371 [Aduncisulcus paluster]
MTVEPKVYRAVPVKSCPPPGDLLKSNATVRKMQESGIKLNKESSKFPFKEPIHITGLFLSVGKPVSQSTKLKITFSFPDGPSKSRRFSLPALTFDKGSFFLEWKTENAANQCTIKAIGTVLCGKRGQHNFYILKCGEYAAIIDSGYSMKPHLKSEVSCYLSDINYLEYFETHDHDDHTGSRKFFRELIEKNKVEGACMCRVFQVKKKEKKKKKKENKKTRSQHKNGFKGDGQIYNRNAFEITDGKRIPCPFNISMFIPKMIPSLDHSLENTMSICYLFSLPLGKIPCVDFTTPFSSKKLNESYLKMSPSLYMPTVNQPYFKAFFSGDIQRSNWIGTPWFKKCNSHFSTSSHHGSKEYTKKDYFQTVRSCILDIPSGYHSRASFLQQWVQTGRTCWSDALQLQGSIDLKTIFDTIDNPEKGPLSTKPTSRPFSALLHALSQAPPVSYLNNIHNGDDLDTIRESKQPTSKHDHGLFCDGFYKAKIERDHIYGIIDILNTFFLGTSDRENKVRAWIKTYNSEQHDISRMLKDKKLGRIHARCMEMSKSVIKMKYHDESMIEYKLFLEHIYRFEAATLCLIYDFEKNTEEFWKLLWTKYILNPGATVVSDIDYLLSHQFPPNISLILPLIHIHTFNHFYYREIDVCGAIPGIFVRKYSLKKVKKGDTTGIKGLDRHICGFWSAKSKGLRNPIIVPSSAYIPPEKESSRREYDEGEK